MPEENPEVPEENPEVPEEKTEVPEENPEVSEENPESDNNLKEVNEEKSLPKTGGVAAMSLAALGVSCTIGGIYLSKIKK